MYKYKIVFFIIFFLGMSFVVFAKTRDNTFLLLSKVIYIDPGHGGRDIGTSYGKILEKDLNLDISLKLRDRLLDLGAIVFMTREEDIDLSSKYDVKKKRGDLYRRTKLINESKADMYLSIHINWFSDPKYGGIDVLYNEVNDKNKILAESFYNTLKRTLNVRRVKIIDGYIYRNVDVVGALIECGFLSNPDDRYLLQQSEYQNKLVDGIVDSIVNYFN